jgi:predicted PurR-regulated permease PerM
MNKPVRISFWFVASTFVLVGVLHLGTPLLATLFSLFILDKLHRTRSKLPAMGAFVVLVLAGSYALAHFTAQAVVALPAVAERAIPSIADYAQARGVELPFTDWESLKTVALETATEQAQYLGAFATGATREAVLLLIGLVVAVSIFYNSQLDLDRHTHPLRDNLYSLTCEALADRFRLFYTSFTTVMGAQIVISAINTALTSVFVFASGLPNAAVVVGVTFLCGLLPVVGNLISNTIITVIAFTVSPQMAALALGFLVLIHKLEYFLNSKIIGDRIRNPVWLTMVGLVLGERLMGIPGMILAPVVLHYVRAEALQIEVQRERAATPGVAPGESPTLVFEPTGQAASQPAALAAEPARLAALPSPGKTATGS